MDLPIVDACVHHQWARQQDVMHYMSDGWREYLDQPTAIGLGEPIPIVPLFPYRRPEGDTHHDAVTSGAPAASSLAVVQQHLDDHGIGRAILTHGIGMCTPAIPNPHLARDVVRAINDWSMNHWVRRDPRLAGLIVLPLQQPDECVNEIHRFGSEDGVAGVLMSANALAKPFGHPIYHPIYEAAAQWDFPVVIHAGGDALSETLSHTSGGGLPSSYGEYHLLRPQSLMTHAASLIVQGVFERYPKLRVLLLGGGFSWASSLFWRFDTEYKTYRRETPWVRRPPSEYLGDNLFISTYPLDRAPTAAQLEQLMLSFGAAETFLIFASGYPDWDLVTPAAVMEQLPQDWARRILYDNASEVFRWEAPSGPDRSKVAQATVGSR